MPEKGRGIEVADDMKFQRRSWRVQRVGWVVMLLVAIAALFGLFGNGPLSGAHAGDTGSGLSISYERFVRKSAQHSIELEAGASSVADGGVKIWIARDWLDANMVVGIIPEPSRSEALPDRIVYTFDAAQSAAPVAIRFELEARWLGSRRAAAGIVNGPTVQFGQFAYP